MCCGNGSTPSPNNCGLRRNCAEILEDAVAGGPWAEHARKLTETTAGCAHLVQNFLTLARQQPPARVPVQLNAIIAPALE